MLIVQCKALKLSIERTLSDSATIENGRFATFGTYVAQYNRLAINVVDVLNLDERTFPTFDMDKMPSRGDSVWPMQRQIIEAVLLNTEMILSYLESATEFSEDEFLNLENFFKIKLRSAIYNKPDKEVHIQNTIENLLVGKGWAKGIDYDRESGKFEFSGKEYIPDFIVPKLGLCIEVKLLREGKKSNIIEEINADITAYSKKYDRQLYIIYDLGVIRDELELRRDIEAE